MTTSRKFIAPALATLAVAIMVLAFVLLFKPAFPAYGSAYPGDPQMSVATTSTAISVTSSTRILASTTSLTGQSYTRAYASVCNPTATLVYINLDGDKATNANTGKYSHIIAAAAGYEACFDITGGKMKYSGSITASSTNETPVLIGVTDYVF